ncbi:hypothetical protein A5791_19900 [Mycobacterium sp. 852002-51163_SCH5372311]|uniref:hypothetical protein n=1 Tax=Mycobacterium sp. 852002-51163_SCH5372311 TaxID=1834097 RepID=UPI0007FDEC9B|nr:hypothetical protein [Mycobacterium sp. 852002-51163_SCH5372311]OBF86960.1 hypothetical protein A5791_19900 [Mycobacterium sp. 852002-51163_SCH5372311]
MSEAIEKQLAGQVISVTIEPKTDAAKVDKSIKDAAKKTKPPEVEIAPKVDAGKVGKQIDDAVKKAGQEAKSQTIELPPIDQAKVREQAKKAGQSISDVIKDAKNTKLELPQFDPDKMRGLGTKLRDAAMSGLRELQNPALNPIKEQIGSAIGQVIGEKIGQAIGNSQVGQWARNIAVAGQGATEGLQGMANIIARFKEGDAGAGLTGVQTALGKIDDLAKTTGIDIGGWTTPIGDATNKAQGLVDKFGESKKGVTEFSDTIKGVTPGIAGALEKWSGPIAAIVMALEAAQPALQHVADLGSKDPAVRDKANTWTGPPSSLPPVFPSDLPPTGTPGGPAPGVVPGGGLAGLGGSFGDPRYGNFDPPKPKAGGGMISGPGSGVSDSILGWPAIVRVSNGEFVTNQRATEQNLPLLQAVNAGAPLWDWIKQLPRFDGGGRVPYGLPVGTNTGGYGSSGAIFPAWVHEIEQRFGVKASTYPGHQEKSGLNKGIDWTGSVDAMQRFAEYLASIRGELEQVIWMNPNTGQKIGVADGQMVGPGTNQPGYYRDDWGGHTNHVHTRQSYSFGGAGGSLPGSGIGVDVSALSGVAASPTGLKSMGPGANPAPAPAPAAAGPGAAPGGGSLSIPTSFAGLSSWGFDAMTAAGEAKSGPGHRDPMAYFPKAASAAVSGQVSSALGAFGIPGAPHWLQGISNFVGGISVGGPGSGGSDSSGGAVPASLSAGASPIPAAAGVPDNVLQGGTARQGHFGDVINIQTDRVEDAFKIAWQHKLEKAATPIDRWA